MSATISLSNLPELPGYNVTETTAPFVIEVVVPLNDEPRAILFAALNAALNALDFDSVSGLRDLLGTKAPLVSPAFTGAPTVPTPASGSNGTQIASTAFVVAAIGQLTAGAPEALNTFLEAYTRFLSDETAAAALTTVVGQKANTADLGNAATKNVGSTAGSVAAGDDSRFIAVSPAASGFQAAFTALYATWFAGLPVMSGSGPAPVNAGQPYNAGGFVMVAQ